MLKQQNTLSPEESIKAAPHCVQYSGVQRITCSRLHPCRTVKTGTSTSINTARVLSYTEQVPFLSVALDLAHAVLLNPAAGIPRASTIPHGRAWLQETLQVCLHFNSVHILPTGRSLYKRLIQLPADTPTHLLDTHPSISTRYISCIA